MCRVLTLHSLYQNSSSLAPTCFPGGNRLFLPCSVHAGSKTRRLSQLTVVRSSRISQSADSGIETSVQEGKHVASFYHVFEIPQQAPLDRGQLKILYPSTSTLKNMVFVPRIQQPCPIVIFLPGAICELNRYQWLGERLTHEMGIVFVLAQLMGTRSLVHVPSSMIHPANTDNDSEDALLKIVIANLAKLNEQGPLENCLDLNNIVLGGHSQGGSVVLASGNEAYYPHFKGIFVYDTVPLPNKTSEDGVASVCRLEGEVPTLIIAGSKDTFLRKIADLVGLQLNKGMNPAQSVFHQCLSPKRPGYYIAFDGAMHMSIVHPLDNTTAATLLNSPEDRPVEDYRELFAHIVILFLRYIISGDKEADKQLKAYSQTKHPLISECEVRP